VLDRHVALIGFMAAGKSTIGRHLARELDVPFIDTDELIVAQNGPVPALFERAGESGFRAAEYEAVRSALQGPVGVVALGGGAVTYEPTRKLLAERALRIYLDISVDTLVLRLRRSPTIRPVVGTAPTEARVRELLSAREPFYREAEIIVTGPRRTKMTFVREILDRIDEYKRSSQSVS
jgi:shikimate kinase